MRRSTYTLWQRFLRFDPADPIWPNRDRYVLSSGHASALLWSMLHLTGVRPVDPDYEVLGKPAVSLEDLRQLPAARIEGPGHPEYRWTSGVEATTGPLGPGGRPRSGWRSRASGSAARYNREGYTLFDFDVSAQAGDGCMMEGTRRRRRRSPRTSDFEPVLDLRLEPGHHRGTHRHHVHGGRRRAFHRVRLERRDRRRCQRPGGGERRSTTFGRARTADVSRAQPHRLRQRGRGHAEGTRRAAWDRGVKATKRFLGWPEDRSSSCRRASTSISPMASAHVAGGPRAWEADVREYRPTSRPRRRDRAYAAARAARGWDADAPRLPGRREGLASRDSSGQVLNALAQTSLAARRRGRHGAVDEDPSHVRRRRRLPAGDRGGRNSHFGVREYARPRSPTGWRCQVRPFWSGFLIFSDFARGAIRLSALMEIPVVHVFTHDSIGVGEDGPTHQPVEQLVSLRAIPGLLVFRPADANEVAETWRYVVQLRREPAVVVLSRQALPTVDRSRRRPRPRWRKARTCSRRGRRAGRDPDRDGLGGRARARGARGARREGIGARVVSMPCSELFDRQPSPTGTRCSRPR